jgi:dipeptidyl aminopeptidase/acylaminoacyl peptidase
MPADNDTLPTLIPRSVLFGNPERVSPQLSPDGTRLAYAAPLDGVMNVFVRTVGAEDDRPVTRETVRPVRSFQWSEDGRYLLYPQDVGGDENFHVLCAPADGDGAATRDLTPGEGVRASVVATDPAFLGTVLVSTNRRDPRVMDVYRCDLATGELTPAAENPGNLVGWTADRTLAVRAAVATRPDGGSDLRVRDSAEGEWRTLVSVPFGETASPLAFSDYGKTLFLLTDAGVNTVRLYAADLATGERTLLHAREDTDVAGVLMHPTEHRNQAVAYNRARAEWVPLDPEVAPDLDAIRAAVPGDWRVISRDDADRTWLIGETRDSGSARYHTYDRASRTVSPLFSAQPALDEFTLSPMTPVDIPARDGLVLPSYLTLPAGREPKNLPLVVSVHGGPWARDAWGYSPYVQWLANRGYAVLQVNYRGSTGFGKAHVNAGNREWAAKMHDDLVDAVGWAVAQGYADPARIAIFGGSYGGYATLVGLTFTPELFACGVDVVGPSNLLTLLESIPPYWAPLKAQFVQRVGDPQTEPEFLKSRSPLFFADRIVRPLFVAQGANDPRVKQAESDQIVAAARKNGKDVTYLLFPDEGHGFARPENNIKFAAAAEAFLARHLGGRAEPAHPGEEPPVVEA